MTDRPRKEIVSRLRGQAVSIPDLEVMFAHWPGRVNPNQDVVKAAVDYILEHHSMTKAVEMKLKRANLALLIASWYPLASAETLKEITFFVCWMYVVDDAIIDKVSWPGHDNATAFDIAFHELNEFLTASLRLDDDMGKSIPASTIPAINSFAGIGEALCRKYTLSQRQAFYDSYVLTMNGYRTEQQLRIAGRLPSWDEYWTYREGSSCIRMCVAIIELSIGSNIVEHIMKSKEMQDLWTETTVLTWLTNDLISAKKEMGEGFIENAVALGAIDTLVAQNGVEFTLRQITESMARLEERAAAVEVKYLPRGQAKGSGDTTQRDVKCFVNSCKYLIRGSISWSVVSPRYGLPSLLRNESGWLSFVVGD